MESTNVLLLITFEVITVKVYAEFNIVLIVFIWVTGKNNIYEYVFIFGGKEMHVSNWVYIDAILAVARVC